MVLTPEEYDSIETKELSNIMSPEEYDAKEPEAIPKRIMSPEEYDRSSSSIMSPEEYDAGGFEESSKRRLPSPVESLKSVVGGVEAGRKVVTGMADSAAQGLKGVYAYGKETVNQYRDIRKDDPETWEKVGRHGLEGAVGEKGYDDLVDERLQKAKEATERGAGSWTYEPKTETGKRYSGMVEKPFEKLHDFAQKSGDVTFEMTGNSDLAASVATAVEFAPMIILPKGIKAVKGIKGKVTTRAQIRSLSKSPEVAGVAKKITDYSNKYGEVPNEKIIKEWWDESLGKEKSPAQKVDAMYDLADTAIKETYKFKPRDVLKKLKSKIIDTSGNIKSELIKKGGDAGKKAVMDLELRAGASAKALRDVEIASKKIFNKLISEEKQILNKVIQSRRTIAIENYKNIEHPMGLGKAEHQAWLDSLPKDLLKKINKRADAYFETMKDQLSQLKENGLLTEKAYETLVKSGDYSPRQFLKHIDPEVAHSVGGQKINVRDSGLKSLKEGSTSLLENDSQAFLEQVVSRTQERIFRNRANNSLYDMAMENPENGVVSVAKKGSEAPAGFDEISVVRDGVRKNMHVPTELATEWVARDPAITAEMANTISIYTGTKMLKAMATGLNPEFAISNMPRDIAHAWLTTEEYSSFMPKAGLQLGRDLAAVAKDAITKKGSYVDYINEGGGMDFLTTQGKVSKSLKGKLGDVQKVLSYAGETSEAMTRLMLRKRALRNGKSPKEATWIARNYLDFSQGGSFAKGFDAGIPYLNASIQGTRGIGRAAIKNPAKFTFKVAQIGTFSTGLYLANKFQNPEAWAQISSRDKVGNWIITTPWAYKDSEGTRRHIFFKIAKDQGQRVVATMAENMMAKAMGEDINVKQVTQSVQDGLPIMPTGMMPPAWEAMYGYGANKDFWLNDDIWKGDPDIEPKEQYTRYTHPAFRTAGQATGLSPEKLRYAMQQVFTRGNIYTSLVGHGWNAMTGQMSDDEKDDVTEDFLLKKPFIRRVAKRTDPYNQYGESMEKTEMEEVTKEYVLTRKFDGLSQKVYDGEATFGDIKKFVKSNEVPGMDKKRLFRRHNRRSKLQGVPDKRWWLEVMKMSTGEAKASAYFNRWATSTEDQKEELDYSMKRLPDIKSQSFQVKLKKLKEANGGY